MEQYTPTPKPMSIFNQPPSQLVTSLTLSTSPAELILSSGDVVTIPYLAASTPAIVSAGTQTISGVKTFSATPTFSALTAGVMTSSSVGVLSSTATPALTSVTFSSNTTTALSSYVEGTFTPTLVLATPGTTSFVFTTQAGTFTRIGNRVFVQAQLTWSTKDNGTGVVTMTGLPYPANASALLQVTGAITGSTIGLSAQTTNNSTTLQIWATGVVGAPGYNQATNVHINATPPSTLDISGSYLTTAAP